MTSPSVPIDSDLPPAGRDTFYVLEDLSVWKTINLTDAGAATWTEILNVATAATVATDPTITDVHFLRIRAATADLIYVLGYASSGGSANPWIWRSSNGGATWFGYLIDDSALSTKDYTVTYQISVVSQPDQSSDNPIVHTHTRVGDDGNTYNPWASATKHVCDPDTLNWRFMTKGADTIHDYNSSYGTAGIIYATHNDLLAAPEEATADGWLDDYFGVGGWSQESGIGRDMPLESGRVKMVFGPTHRTTAYEGPWTVTGESWVFWNFPSVTMPSALDVAATNNNWLYVGLNDKIMASEDGGVTWFDFYTSHGANDICIDPQAAGAIYYWSTDGNLNLLVKQTLGQPGVLQTEGLMTETPRNVPLRIARDLQSGRLLAIADGTTFIIRNLATNTTVLDTIVGGRGLHVYLNRKLIFVEATGIYICNDFYVEPPVFENKTGDWLGDYANGINGHRLVSTI